MNDTKAESVPDFSLEDVTVEIVPQFFSEEEGTSSNKKNEIVRRSVTTPRKGYTLLPNEKHGTSTKKRISMFNNKFVSTPPPKREPGREMLAEWRRELLSAGQVCCPFKECGLSYCSLPGLILHYRACTEKRDDQEAVKCKICRNYVSGRISLAHHNRLLHHGKPMKSVSTFMETQQNPHSSSPNSTKSRRVVRKPMRYRDITEDDDELCLSMNQKVSLLARMSDLASSGQPLHRGPGRPRKHIPATQTSPSEIQLNNLNDLSNLSEEALEELKKSSFLHKMGLRPTTESANGVSSLSPSCFSSLSLFSLSNQDTESSSPPSSDTTVYFSSLKDKFLCWNESDGLDSSCQDSVSKCISFTDSSPSSVPNTVPRKRGRPKKIKPEDLQLKIELPVNQDIPVDPNKLSPTTCRKKKMKQEDEETEELNKTPPKIPLLPKMDSPGAVVCGVCKKTFGNAGAFRFHAIAKHNGLARPLNDNRPFTEAEEKEILRKTFRQLGKLICPHDTCHKPLISLPGFFQHLKNCHKEASIDEDEPIPSHSPETNRDILRQTLKKFKKLECPHKECSKQFISLPGYLYHLKNCPKLNPKESDTIQLKVQELLASEPGAKIESLESDSPVTCGHCKKVYENETIFLQHNMTKHNGLALPEGDTRTFTDPEKRKILLRTLRQIGRLCCYKQGCNKSFITLQGFLVHDGNCVAGIKSADNLEKPSIKSTQVICSVCKEEFWNNSRFLQHTMMAHNGLARPTSDDRPFSEEERMKALRQTLRSVKKLRCLRDNCAKNFTTLGGYLYHFRQCGNELYLECPICGKRLKEGSLKPHLKLAHPPSPPHQPTFEEKKEELPIEINVAGHPRRRAAKRAMAKVQEIARGVDVEEDTDRLLKRPRPDSLDKDFNPFEDVGNDKKPKYTKPTAVHISTAMFKEWKKELLATEKITCKNKGCTMKLMSVWGMRTHFLSCSFGASDKFYTCLACGKKTRQEPDMLRHVEIHGLDNISSGSATDQDDSDTEIDEKSVHLQSPYERMSGPSSYTSSEFQPFKHSFAWRSEFLKKNFTNNLFPDWRPRSSQWLFLKEEEHGKYLPKTQESPNFKRITISREHLQHSTDNGEWIKLKLFEVNYVPEMENSGLTFFCGGPIWACSWCPTPVSQPANQYLALYCHQNMDKTVALTEIYKEPGLIQIWKIGNLYEEKISICPSFELGLAHDTGHVWALEWCPSGCWEDPQKNCQNDLLPCLGLLAAACSDGLIHIYCVPHPQKLPTVKKLPIYKAPPTVILKSSAEQQGAQCLSLAWLQSKGHNLIAGGFSNGWVILWDLSSRSPLLLIPVSNCQVTILPYKTFIAHSTAVYGVAWSPLHGGQYLGTSSIDRQLKFWSTDDLSLPYNSFSKGSLLSVRWCSHWCCLFSSQDDCYNLKHNCCQIAESGYFGYQSKILTSHNGCVWDLSVSEWLNCSASCDSSGEVVGFLLSQMMYNIANSKGFHRRRFPVYRTSVVPLNSKNESNTENDETKKKDTSEQEQQKVSLEEKEKNNIEVVKECKSSNESSKTTSCASKEKCVLQAQDAETNELSSAGPDTHSESESHIVTVQNNTCEEVASSSVDTPSLQNINRTPDSSLTAASDESIKSATETQTKAALTNETSSNSIVNNPKNLSELSELKKVSEDITLNSAPENLKKLTLPKPYVPKPRIYSEIIKDYGLVFHDATLSSYKNIPIEELKRLAAQNPPIMNSTLPDRFPLQSINRVQWNPNLGCHLWLATGGHSGLVRIHCAELVNQTVQSQIVSQLRENSLDSDVNKCTLRIESLHKETDDKQNMILI